MAASSGSAHTGSATKQIALPACQSRTTRYRFITPYFAGSIWYDDSGLWVRLLAALPVPSEAVMPIHPGALNYYREAGLLR